MTTRRQEAARLILHLKPRSAYQLDGADSPVAAIGKKKLAHFQSSVPLQESEFSDAIEAYGILNLFGQVSEKLETLVPITRERIMTHG